MDIKLKADLNEQNEIEVKGNVLGRSFLLTITQAVIKSLLSPPIKEIKKDSD